METSPALTNADFTDPWRDLRNRLKNGSFALRDRRSETADPKERTRLVWKQDGVEHALDQWDRLNDDIAAGTLEHVNAWHLFTLRVTDLYTALGAHPGYHQGVGLALSYQRGYGHGIDPRVTAAPAGR